MTSQRKTLDTFEIVPRPVLDDITVLIPTLGRSILERCLQYIEKGSCWPGQIVVVDQGSNSKIANWLAKLQTIGIQTLHIQSSQQGRAASVNRGLEKLKTKFVVITDDDCFVDVDWIKNMAKRLDDSPESIVSGRVEPFGDGGEVVAIVTSKKSAIYHRPQLKFDAMSGGNMGTSAAVIEHVGLFDEAPLMRCAEDGDWAYRALRSGVTIIYAPEVSVQHYGWRDEAQRTDQYKIYARSHGAFYGKYLRKGDLFIALRVVIHYFRALRRWLRGILKKDRESEIRGFAYLTGLLPGIIRGIRRDIFE
ncbi:MAG: glycosyltransferase family 2 protein [Planctomycetota bacterium]|jgi:GT2 family glycosyltransferase